MCLKNKNIKYLECLILFLLLLFAGYLRLINLENNPGIYSDEGTQIEISQNLLKGKIQYFSLSQSTLLVGRLPLFSIFLSIIFKLFGVGLLQLRVFSAILAILTILLLYLILKSILGNQAGFLPLLSVFLFSIYPSAIIFHRLGFSYHLLSIFILLVFWGLWQYWKTESLHWLILTSICLGLGSLVDLSGFTFYPFAFFLILLKDFRKIPLFLCVSLLPFTIYAVIMLLLSPHAFVFDFQFIFNRVNNGLGKQLIFLFFNIYELILKDSWIIFGLLGLFFLKNKNFGVFTFFYLFIPFAFSARHSSMTGLSYYYFIPFFSIVIIGVAGFTQFFFEAIKTSFEEFFHHSINKYRSFDLKINQKNIGKLSRYLSALLLSIFLVPTFIFSLYQILQDLNSGLKTPMSPLMVNYSEAQGASEFINNRVTSGDLVVASPAVAWMINSNRVDFQISIAFNGKPSIHLPANIPPDRFSYNSDYHTAKFVIIDNIWTSYAIHNNFFIRNMFENIEKWPMVWSGDQVRVYMNDNFN